MNKTKFPIGHHILYILKEELGISNPRIAFCPYKREMWNSISSIYEAAVEEGLDCFVAPLIYFIRDPEGNIDPTDPRIDPIKGIRNENCMRLKELKPDVIFIHYPYDFDNNITYIYDEVQTDKLKDIAKLAYTAYHGGESFDDTIMHPGVANASYIFAVSKEDKERFLKVFPKHKVFDVGTPKLEAVSAMLEHKRRTVLLLNSLVPFLENPLAKMQQYMDIVEKEDGVIIFRPHPLLDHMVSSMIPEIQEQYKKFKEYMESNAIIDRSSSPDGVINIADFMYTDKRSTVIRLWKLSGKPYEIIRIENDIVDNLRDDPS